VNKKLFHSFGIFCPHFLPSGLPGATNQKQNHSVCF